MSVHAYQTKQGKKWKVIWGETRTINGAKDRRQRTKGGFAKKQDALAFDAARKTDKANGVIWTAEQDRNTVTIEVLARDFVAATRARAPGKRTWKTRMSILNKFGTAFGAGSRPATDLSRALLLEYRDFLPDNQQHRYVGEVERMWAWGWDEPETYPGVPRPRKVTGKDIFPPSPPSRVADATWADLDTVIDSVSKEWHRRAGLILRYQGLRVAQALALRWEQVNLSENALTVLPQKSDERLRCVPLHPALAEEMAGWGVREGPVFVKAKGKLHRADEPTGPFTTAWRRAGIPEERWGGGPFRRHNSPTHTFRATIQTGLRLAGVQEVFIDFYIGHVTNATRAAYEATQQPGHSYWPGLLKAQSAIPRVGESGEPAVSLNAHR